ncbi:MAG TPA: phosphoribosylformylglycinamidine synthase subunit PurL [Thermomicrobiales bacterium]|nr:phosphoribosylformylglycinamidine synthase subunit PurL [Thermomicrobiales bacterium]
MIGGTNGREDGTRSAVVEAPWREVALTDDEYVRIVELLGREPAPVELGMFGAMWSEHCGYKHSRPLFRHMPTDAPWVVQGPGENAGAVDIGDGLAIVFKVESHNHPSAVEPYQGAATGVGGIVRDIFTMGARPIALLDALRFGPLDLPRNRYLFTNVVAGIGGYGNCLGIPTVGGEVFFDESYNGNPLVNAMCAGIAEHGQIMGAKASGPGNLIMLIGADTGRDGVHGATFASVEDPTASHRGVIQVGNPFLEKLLMEACLELLEGDDVVAMQDLGAAGLTSSLVECASRGGVGAEIDVALAPRRAEHMTAYEMMLSESQERMLLVVRPAGAERVREIVERHSLHANVIGRVTDDGLVRVLENGEVRAEVPASFFTDACPTYTPDAEESAQARQARERDVTTIPDLDPGEVANALLTLLGSANIGSRRPIFEQYDSTIRTDTVVPPGDGDAAVLRIKGSERGVAIAIDCNGRYCALDPELGARHAVAEATRNVACTGARPLGVTNCLNFASPEKPAGYFQLRQAVLGMSAACRGLNVPVVSGNVSLYNESADGPIWPTPVVGVVGVLDQVARHATMRWREGDHVLLIGGGRPTLGGSEYLATVHGIVGGDPPALDLVRELAVQRLVTELIQTGVVRTAHDCSDGGLAVALAEMAIASGCGVAATGTPPAGEHGRVDEQWFGEAASRVIVACADADVAEVRRRCAGAGPVIDVIDLGNAGGNSIQMGDSVVSLDAARERYDHALNIS